MVRSRVEELEEELAEA